MGQNGESGESMVDWWEQNDPKKIMPDWGDTPPHLKWEGLHRDSPNLYLLVRPGRKGTLRRSWIFRYRRWSEQRNVDMGLGRLDDVDIVEARLMAKEARKLLLQHIDPLEHRNELHRKNEAANAAARAATVAAGKTFEICVREYLDPHGKNTPTFQQWSKPFNLHVYPVFGSRPVSSIGEELVRDVLDPIWDDKTPTAKLIRSRIEKVLDFATRKSYRTGPNPASQGHIAEVFGKRGRATDNRPALPYPQIAEYMAELKESDTLRAIALRFMILTAMRTTEALWAMWDEIDMERRVWTIPAARMKIKTKSGKAREDHTVYLTDPVMEILRYMEPRRISAYVFPGGNEDQGMAECGLLKFVRTQNRRRKKQGLPMWIDPKKDKEITPHGFRSTFKSWAMDKTNAPDFVSEMCLAHDVGDATHQAYSRGQLFEKRKALMTKWAKYVETVVSKTGERTFRAPVFPLAKPDKKAA